MCSQLFLCQRLQIPALFERQLGHHVSEEATKMIAHVTCEALLPDECWNYVIILIISVRVCVFPLAEHRAAAHAVDGIHLKGPCSKGYVEG